MQVFRMNWTPRVGKHGPLSRYCIDRMIGRGTSGEEEKGVGGWVLMVNMCWSFATVRLKMPSDAGQRGARLTPEL